MRITDAVDLVETALTHGRGGEVFIPRIKACGILTIAEAVAPGLPWVETGIRRGEKLHEQLIGEDESRDAMDHGTHYTIEPARTWEQVPDAGGDRLQDGFTLRSDTVDQLTVGEMRSMIKCGE
jgi:UDP-N-acetylglucosamine 4,6-dehydratase